MNRLLFLSLWCLLLPSCVASIGLPSKANEKAFYDEVTSHFHEQDAVVNEIRKVLGVLNRENQDGVSYLITPRAITKAVRTLPAKSKSHNWCDVDDIRILEFRSFSCCLSPALGALPGEDWEGLPMVGILLRLGSHEDPPTPGIEIPLGKVEEAERLHALFLKLIEMSRCE